MLTETDIMGRLQKSILISALPPIHAATHFTHSKVLVSMYVLFTVGSQFRYFCYELVVPRTDMPYIFLFLTGSM